MHLPHTARQLVAATALAVAALPLAAVPAHAGTSRPHGTPHSTSGTPALTKAGPGRTASTPVDYLLCSSAGLDSTDATTTFTPPVIAGSAATLVASSTNPLSCNVAFAPADPTIHTAQIALSGGIVLLPACAGASVTGLLTNVALVITYDNGYSSVVALDNEAKLTTGNPNEPDALEFDGQIIAGEFAGDTVRYTAFLTGGTAQDCRTGIASATGGGMLAVSNL